MAEFSNTVCALRNGQVELDLSAGLKDIVAGVRDTKRAGKLTLTIDIGLDKDDPRLIRIATGITIKKPERPPAPDTFYIRNNRLISIDDVQYQLQFGQEEHEPKYIDVSREEQANEPKL